MTQPETILCDYLRMPHEINLTDLDMPALSVLFVDTCVLAAACPAIVDAHWLLGKDGKQNEFTQFLRNAFNLELAPLKFLEPMLTEIRCKELQKASEKLIQQIVQHVKTLGEYEYREVLRAVMQAIQIRVAHEKLHRSRRRASANRELDLSLFRAFDAFDSLLGIDYDLDRGMQTVPDNTERLYEGAGVGVQSSYSSLLIALQELNPKKNARIIDLGSGYGRFGFVIGLLRPDIDFIGYEYVFHRVACAQKSVVRAGLNGKIRFLTQDLADASFQIPDAEIYYLYDPFSESTYRHVFNQLQAMSRRFPVCIVTKGNAGAWIENALQSQGWTNDRSIDSGAVGIFSSPA